MAGWKPALLLDLYGYPKIFILFQAHGMCISDISHSAHSSEEMISLNIILWAFLLLMLIVSFSGAVSAQVKYEKATFAGGCFWCMEHPFEKLNGVKSVISGYTGGQRENPTYEEVCSGKTGHLEAVEITFDPTKISFDRLLDVYWMQIDPTDPGGQFADRGSQYNTAIFYHNEDQKKRAEKSKKDLEKTGKFKKPVAVKILKREKFYPAEEYHQDYYRKNSGHYKMYRKLSGREDFLDRTWTCPLRPAPDNK